MKLSKHFLFFKELVSSMHYFEYNLKFSHCCFYNCDPSRMSVLVPVVSNLVQLFLFENVVSNSLNSHLNGSIMPKQNLCVRSLSEFPRLNTDHDYR